MSFIFPTLQKTKIYYSRALHSGVWPGEGEEMGEITFETKGTQQGAVCCNQRLFLDMAH